MPRLTRLTTLLIFVLARQRLRQSGYNAGEQAPICPQNETGCPH